MRILILGTDYCALRFRDFFERKLENDVFSFIKNSKNYIDYITNADITDFCLANDINLVVVTEEKYILSNLCEELSEKNITVFSPSVDVINLTYSKAFAKKFIYKNQIPSPKFFIAEKISHGFDYIKTSRLPVAIKPDNHSYQEGTLFCETKKEAVKTIEKLFNSGNKKIVIEDYIEGKNLSIWTICDGYRAKIIGINYKYQNDIAYTKANLLSNDIISKIQSKIISKTINALVEENNEYVGVLGFDIIIAKNNNPVLIGYNSFFDDISVDFYIDEEFTFEEIFQSTIEGSLFLKDILPDKTDFRLNIRDNNEIISIKAKTKSNLDRFVKENDIDTKELFEAKKLWQI